MRTILTSDPVVAAGIIDRGQLVAFPTETVYGLGADMANSNAVRSVFVAKGRPDDNPLIVHVGRLGAVERLASEVPDIARALIDTFFPGPLTLLLPKSSTVSDLVTAGSPLVGIRMPNHPLALDFLKRCANPVVAPSANTSGRPSPTTWQAVREDLDGRIACILKGDQTEIGLESTVVDVSGATPIVLRPGAISMDEIRAVAGSGRLAGISDDDRPSPGTRYRHYSPDATVHIVVRPSLILGHVGRRDAWIGISPPPDSAPLILSQICADVDDYASALYDYFRTCDRQGIQNIWCQAVPVDGIGQALMDRLQRAAIR